MNKKAITIAVVTWFLFLGLYLLFCAKADPAEAVTGGAAALLALWLVGMLRDSFRSPLRLKPSWLLLLWRIPFAMFSESWLLLVALLHRIAGREEDGVMIEHRFDFPADEHESARRAWMTFGVCITPNSYLVFLDKKKKRVLIRQLVGKELSTIDRLFVELP
ncbi:hypothetical protein M1B72_08295 [Geomonas paludis]|uniref:Uncharacterized protein n=1 Tax=Geomonas paludis TaxID=2740185 RepID=A0A6V8MUT0_9BACT|nr:hypothetical protein [Geomonas paludis]UPU37693.1 hypothetical protein M1B72_08295 [Geomonas paludis]GFO63771.1 hypothetical protein GMPD_16900 [Geomonas paludis]